jgi:hypothetical protein
MCDGVESESVSKRSKEKRRMRKDMMPNLSGVDFKDALKALVQTPAPKGKKPKQ